MDNETLFYAFGIALAISAVLASFAGLRIKSFPGKLGLLVVIWFVVLVGGSSVFAVRHAEDEQHHKQAELSEASQEAEEEESH